VRLAVDTNGYSAAARGEQRAVQLLRSADEILLPFVVVGELRAGFAAGTIGLTNESKLTLFLNSPRVHLLFADDQTTFHYARIFAELRRAGTPIPTNDLWIAALVIQHQALLFTRDAHFAKIAAITRV
jgi:tRNA(fMet)-specific endonuclease VapC